MSERYESAGPTMTGCKMTHYKLSPGLWTLGLLAVALWATPGVWAQDTSTPPASGTPDASPQTQEPIAAYGQDNPPPPVIENPPLSGIDLPNVEPHAAPLSYIQPGATVSQSIDTNPETTPGGQSAYSVSRALGSVTLQRLWSHYDVALDYEGGAAYYSLHGEGFKALQQMDLNQKISWKRGELNVRESFSYLPEGNFGAAYGSLGSTGMQSLGNTGAAPLLSGAILGSEGLVPRILNISMADVSEYLSPKSAITAAAGYGFTHFYGSDSTFGAEPVTFIGSSEVFAQVGYNRILSSHTQVAIMYAYQDFNFNFSDLSFHSNVFQLVYGHRISGRLDFLIGAGPQLTSIGTPSEDCSDPTVPPGLLCALEGDTNIPVTVKDQRLGVAGRVRLRYKFPKTFLQASYNRYETSGSGLFAGSQTDLAQLTISRPLTRVWSLSGDLGYSRNARLQPLSAAELDNCGQTGQPACPGVNANSYTYGFAGAAVHRQIGHNFHAFVSYQFNELSFDNSFCAGTTICNRISNRQVATFGLDWTPRPIRLD